MIDQFSFWTGVFAAIAFNLGCKAALEYSKLRKGPTNV